MIERDRRKTLRIGHKFQVSLHHTDQSREFQGITDNLSQGGALITTGDLPSFDVPDQAILTFWLPPEFSGQNRTIGLRGAAAVVRIDSARNGVGVQFVDSFRQFQRVDDPNAKRESRYRKLAHYLSAYADMDSTEFAEMFQVGVLVEQSKMVFDRDIIFQVSTVLTDSESVFDQTKQESIAGKVLEARILEIKKKGDVADTDMVTLGRSSRNDLVLYNKLISRKHAQLHYNSTLNTCSLVDLGSTNGTFLNNDKLVAHDKHQLTDGDEISFGPDTKVIYFSAREFHNLLVKMKPPKH
jgi:hypothetical protein